MECFKNHLYKDTFYSTVYTLTCQLGCYQIFLTLVYIVTFILMYFPSLKSLVISIEYIWSANFILKLEFQDKVVKCKVRYSKAFIGLTMQCSSILHKVCAGKIYSPLFISETPLVADNFLTTLWIRIGRTSADNPAGRFGCYNAASV